MENFIYEILIATVKTDSFMHRLTVPINISTIAKLSDMLLMTVVWKYSGEKRKIPLGAQLTICASRGFLRENTLPNQTVANRVVWL
jgi:hypothetical protein